MMKPAAIIDYIASNVDYCVTWCFVFTRVIVIFHVIVFAAKRVLCFNASIYVPKFVSFTNSMIVFL